MVLTHQLVVALTPPTATSWQETVEFESGRTWLCCMLSVVGKQAANVGKEMLGVLKRERVYSAETAYTILEQCQQLAAQSGVILSCALVFFRGTRVVFATIRVGVGLRRQTLARMLLMPDDSIQIKEGSGQLTDSYVLFTQLGLRFGEQLLQVSAQPVELSRMWRSLPTLSQFLQSPGLIVALLVTPEFITQYQIESTNNSTVELPTVTPTPVIEKRRSIWHFPRLIRKSRKKKRRDILPPAPQPVVGPTMQATPKQDSLPASQRVRSSFYRLLQAMQSLWHSFFPSRQVYVGAQVSRKKLIVVGGILVSIVLLVTVGSFFWLAQQRLRSETLIQLAPYREALESITQVSETDPLAARELIQQQLASLGELQAQPGQTSFARAQIEDLLKRSKALYDSIALTTALDSLPLYDDLRRLSPSFVASKTSGNNNVATFADQEQKLLLKYDVMTQSGLSVDAASLATITAVTQGSSDSFILGETITSLVGSDSAQLVEVVAQSAVAEGGTLIATFDDNLYVLNPSKRALYRYIRTGSQYGSPSNWLTGAVPFPLSEVTSMVVDGDIWFGTSTGGVQKFVSGKQQEFVLTGLEKPLISSVYVATAPDHEYLYILEPSGKRVVKVKKTGEVVQEFVNSALGSATALWLDESNNRLFVVSGASIYALPL